MKRFFAALILCALTLISSCAFADASYTSGDHLGLFGLGSATVISKSVTIRSKPSYSGDNVVSASGGDTLLVLSDDSGDWVEVQYTKGKKKYQGWVIKDYIVCKPMTITLRKSNIPAYSAPTLEAKKVGSLSKYTELTVIGIWGNYYIVSLREAAAFIPIDADVWTSTEIYEFFAHGLRQAQVTSATILRSGPSNDWPEAITCKPGAHITIGSDEQNGWYIANYDGTIGYVNAADITFE